ncbi:ABC transporter substrate-binding protein [Jannaschia seohaensis]|uniref:Alpha-glucoside transport system substrate-binding protein n=1 Tax=Jannaschia seohaensis TaxID=475081 RepID=A0A2Y9B550_9RHOB|nr:ABC transporter substrate-binding protein [Jannaschia seohaensis]PWJ10940.1 alpha-glucoside transport system substrate-binding protein [Jannaschia seohaensis]SSA51541.1 alpha-glucoside transport system substrate-binding protein [Jannaschia seohaensis]
MKRSTLRQGAGALALLAAQGASAQELLFPIGEGAFSWGSYETFAAETDLTGQSLSVTGASTGEDGKRLQALYAYFTEATGAEVSYSGSESFEQDIVINAQAGGLPDIANFPQPGLARDLAARGTLKPFGPELRDFVTETYAAGSSWADLGTFPGPDGQEEIYGIFFGTDVKSLVWYVPAAFDEAGYDIPETMEELKALTDQIVEDGGTPWCIGLASGAATGWPATDWVEDMMLRTVTPEEYDQWVRNEMPFDDPRVIRAIEEFGHFARNDAFVAGGVQGVAATDFRDSPDALFDIPPGCYMHRQASFIPFFFPEGQEPGVDVDFFYFPAFESEDLGRPVLGSGGLITMTTDTPAARAFIDFLGTPIAHEIMMAQGQFLTPHKDANTEIYTSDLQRSLGRILTEATTFRFDGSDLMPGEIGTAAFWTGMIDYVTGESAEEVAAKIQTRWDSIR